MFNDHLRRFGGLDVQDWEPGHPLPDPARAMPRIAVAYDDPQPWPDKLAAYVGLPGAAGTRGLVVGQWHKEMSTGESPAPMVAALAGAATTLTNLEVLFVNDVTVEESEVSWFQNTDLSPLTRAYPNLHHLTVRGGLGLRLPGLSLPRLRLLVIESGGLSAELVRDVMAASLPALEHLELYLGTDEYGGTSSVTDLAPLLSGGLFPALRSLGLKDCDYQDDVARAVASCPLLDRLEVLDLSLGTLSDVGGEALATSPGVRRLRRLDLHHHWLSEPMMARLQSLGPEVDLSDRQDPDDDDYRYVAIGE